MNVYVLEHIYHRGSEIVGVFTRHNLAYKSMVNLYGEMEPHFIDTEAGIWNYGDQDIYDYITIIRYEVLQNELSES